MYEVSYWTISGILGVGTRYATILAVLATAVMTCYAFFMTPSHPYRLVSSIFCAPTPSKATSVERRPASEKKDAPVDLFTSTFGEDLALVHESDSRSDSQSAAHPIVEHQASPVESDPEVADGLPPSQPGSTTVRSESEIDVSVSEVEGQEAEDSPELEPSHIDGDLTNSPLPAHPEVEPGASSPDAAEGPCIVEALETACTTSEGVSDSSDSSERSAECLVTVHGPSLPQTLAPVEMDASMLSMEIPFLLSVESGSSMDDEAHSDIERLTEDGTVAASLSTCGVPAETTFAQAPCSTSDPLRGDVPSDIMHSALLVPTLPAADGGKSSPETAFGVEEDDDWTPVDPDESSTPRPSSPAEPRSEMVEATSVNRIGMDDLAVSAVLLTQSQYASVILSPNASDDSNLSSPMSATSSASSRSIRPRVHTSDRPDWAVAAHEEREDDARCERTQRRHSVDTPDWAVAPSADTSGGARKKGRRSDPGSGARKKPRRARASC